jgi:ubiquitin carboxyl-terminal hydrolase 4/11
MNSALQCLVHCKELTEYFLAQVYKQELNETNPLGMGGQLAKHYAYLIAALFNPEHTKPSLPPSEFKKTLGRFAPNFSGYGQQDSQEFLAFLLGTPPPPLASPNTHSPLLGGFRCLFGTNG